VIYAYILSDYRRYGNQVGVRSLLGTPFINLGVPSKDLTPFVQNQNPAEAGFWYLIAQDLRISNRD